MLRLFSFLLCIFVLASPSKEALAQTSLDLRGNVGGSGIAGGSLIPGFDVAACTGTIEGAIRYNSASNCTEFCNGSDWTCLNVTIFSNTTPPTSCPDIGDTCDDGSIYAGISPDGLVKLYTTPADAGQFSWNDGTSTPWVDTAMVNCTTGAQASCYTGEANTALLAALGTTPSPAPYVAARHCDGLTAHGHSDWYLPARDELNILYTNHVAIGAFNISGSFRAGLYWASSERNKNASWPQRFSDGSQSIFFNKNEGVSVRCVRR